MDVPPARVHADGRLPLGVTPMHYWDDYLAVYIWRLTSEPTAGSTEIVWGTATVLLACVLLFNLLARLLGKLLSRRLTAE